VLALAVVLVVILVRYQGHRTRTKEEGAWEALMARADQSAWRGGEGALDLAEVAREVAGSPAEAWARALAVSALARKGDLEAATSSLEELRRLGGRALTRDRMPWGQEDVPLTLVEYLERCLQQETTWRAAHAGLYSNPDPPATGARVRLKTGRGDIVVQLYPDRAPAHVDNFLSRVRAGSYDGTRFHRVIAGSRVYGGDPLSVQEDLESVRLWGQGGADEILAPEESGLFHFAGVLAAEPAGAGKEGSRGWQFCLTVGPSHELDSAGTVFGKVTEGLEVVQAIGAAEVAEGTQRPREPVVLESAVEL
jgi:cyclophilin family peptidyl-prolyl cis-trans isomerase